MGSEAERWLSHQDLAGLLREVLEQGQGFRFRADGISMRPFIVAGDVLVIEPVRDAALLRYGDVVLYRTPCDGLVAHRVIGPSRANPPLPGSIPAAPVEGSLLRTRGDGLRAPIEQVGPEQVLGRVVAVERAGRRFELDRLGQRLRVRLWLTLRAGVDALRLVRNRFRRQPARGAMR